MKRTVLQNCKYLETESNKKKCQKTLDLGETPRPFTDLLYILPELNLNNCFEIIEGFLVLS